MLKATLMFFFRLKQHEPLYTYLFSKIDRDFTKEMYYRLEPSYLMVELFFGSSYVTSNVLFEQVFFKKILCLHLICIGKKYDAIQGFFIIIIDGSINFMYGC